MYEFVRGRINQVTPTHAVVDCNGLGYHIQISLNTYAAFKDKQEGLLYTHFVVREDAHLLFGFADEAERELFRLLISVSGVGAATARMILSSLHPAEIEKAILSGDVATLKRIKGIGAKSAERIIIDLRDKVGKTPAGTTSFLSAPSSVSGEASLALVALGFARNLADKAVAKAVQESGDNQRVEEIIKQALKYL